jgi:hypothetical protein
LTERKSHGRKQTLRQLAEVIADLRLESKEKGLDKMSKRDINAAVAATRKGLKNSSNRAVKSR